MRRRHEAVRAPQVVEERMPDLRRRGQKHGLKYPVAAMAHHTATTPTTIATLGQIWLIALRIQGSALHLLREIVVDVDDDLRQEHVLERPRPWCRDPILGEQRSRSGRHDDHTVRQEDGLERCASRTGRCCRPRTTPAEAPAAGSLETAHRAHRTARRRAAPPAVPQALGRGPHVGASRAELMGLRVRKAGEMHLSQPGHRSLGVLPSERR